MAVVFELDVCFRRVDKQTFGDVGVVTEQDVYARLVVHGLNTLFRGLVVVSVSSVHFLDSIAHPVGFGENAYHQELMIRLTQQRHHSLETW